MKRPLIGRSRALFGERGLAAEDGTPNLPLMSTSDAKTATILVVEDRREVLDVLQHMLQRNGYDVLVATDGDAAIETALANDVELIILDVGLPRRSGLDVARTLRERGRRTPVLMLTGFQEVRDKLAGFEAGADDYLTKPFDTDELLARVKALLRRSTLRAEETVLKVGDLTVDPISREVRRGGRLVSLTQKEYALLEFLVRNAGRTVSREEISEQVWKHAFDPRTNIVDVYVNYLRKKLDSAEEPSMLHTVRGVGYVLKA